MMPGLGIRAQRKKHGALARLKCPACDSVHWFDLVENRTKIRAIVVLDQTTNWSLECSACGYSIDVTKDDAMRAQTF
jgi:C4-type Zn-finger protein